jgi:hypothetical protein
MEKREQREREDKEKLKTMNPADKKKFIEKLKKQDSKKARNKVIKF